MAAVSKTSSVIFYYDIVCPFAYMASRLVEGVCQRAGATVHWRPVLLGTSLITIMISTLNIISISPKGGLYEFTQASQGRGGSATDVMSASKLRVSGQGRLTVICNWI